MKAGVTDRDRLSVRNATGKGGVREQSTMRNLLTVHLAQTSIA